MNSVPSKLQVLNLYRCFLRYGRDLELTDKDFFFQRIKSEFRKKKVLSDPELAIKAYEVRPFSILSLIFQGLILD